jgi:hypothetical protein
MAEGFAPRLDVLQVGVDEGPVDVEYHGFDHGALPGMA